ncbi:MAG TPA: NADH-quinone oxidoreductase subunit NuoE [Clostridiaceae bacterium]|jgi:NADH-quinone oxidoreductase subunit E/NADP-reducing hydrogenase subunit HndA|nr:NADH-quinone oxidoreductase subunit NuoE [Clostridiaceae bacterium]HBG39645.1 NADH-quinone oxidoreductase subunit NuoE [Clostridiaceae bacterium]HBN28974.1 NADH-quinone oxidoreductase subunit NuoE [Clostridiaceae bacterium]HBX48979.1 NADH-quinone oxidoreductase subunit NuoE [Clostridiaceae bacterium]
MSNAENRLNDFDPNDSKGQEVKKFIQEHKNIKGGLIPVLHKIQDVYGYLPKETLNTVSDSMNIPLTEIYGVASFYSYFSLTPKGKHVIRVCLGTACYVKNSQAIIDEIGRELGITVGQTTSDGKFTLEATRCLGACGLSPVMMIDDKVFGRLVKDDVPKILSEFN